MKSHQSNCILLLIIAASQCWGAGQLPGVRARFSEGQLREVPTGSEATLVQSELYPDQPFMDPIDPATTEQFRQFYEHVGPGFSVTTDQLSRLHQRAELDPVIHDGLQMLLAQADAWLDQPVPSFEPSPFVWLQAPVEVATQIERKYQQMSAMRQTCALAFAITGREAYAEKAWDALSGYISHFYTYGVFRMPCSWQSPWDTGTELYEAVATYDLIAHWEGLHPLDHALVFNYLRRMGQRVAYAVELSPVIGSEQAAWTSALGSLALYMPSLPESARWSSLVDERMESVMADFMTDGGHIECTPAIHQLALEHVLRYAALSDRLGGNDLLRTKWGPGQVSLESACDWLARIATPLGETPALNDSRSRKLATYAEFLDAAGLYKRADWLLAGRLTPPAPWLLHELPAGLSPADPTYRSVLLPDTGVAVMRDGWDEDDGYLLLDFGRHGGPHGHFDKLSFILYARGQPWVLDAGSAPSPSLVPEENETWHRQTIAHNTVVVGDHSQRPVDGTIEMWQTGSAFDIVIARHEAYEGITHRRAVFHPRDGYFLVFDELISDLDEPQDLRWLAHINGRRESGTMGRMVFWRQDGQGLTVVPAARRGLRKVEMGDGLCGGCDGASASFLSPPESGIWQPGDPGWARIPFVALRKTLPSHGVQTYCVALVPFMGTEPDVEVKAADGDGAYGIEVKIGDVRDRLLVRRYGASGPAIRAAGLRVEEGNWGYVREVAGRQTVLETDALSLSLD